MWNCAKNKRHTQIEYVTPDPDAIWKGAISVCAMFLFTLIAAISLSVTGCQGCSDKALARLTKSEGPTERDHGDTQNKWHPAIKGDRFFIDDGIRTGNNATAELWLRDGSGLRMQPNSLVRFSKTRPGKNQIGLQIEEGVIFIDASTDDLKINTRYGVAVLEKGTRIKLTRGPNGVILDVEIGSARFLGKDEQAQMLTEGQRLRITLEAAVLIPDDEVDDRSDSNKPAADTEINRIVTSEESVSNADTGKDTALEMPRISDGSTVIKAADQQQPHLMVAAGETAWIHAFSSPIHVAIRFADVCPEGGAVKLSGANSKYIGAAQAVVPLKMGRRRYQIFCTAENQTLKKQAGASGMLHVVRDRGRVKLALTPPISTILMDGRTWNVNYQSRLPAIRVKWSTPPKGDKFTLHVSGETPQTISLSRPFHLFRSGKLKEGTHTIKFIEDSSGVRSRRTTVRIQFDNASDKAVLMAPREKAFGFGETVTVRGTVMPGWKVGAPGGRITLDNAGRFEGTVKHNPGYQAVWLRLSHPRRGVHYYLRSASNQ